jgi:hypothetical protein
MKAAVLHQVNQPMTVEEVALAKPKRPAEDRRGGAADDRLRLRG